MQVATQQNYIGVHPRPAVALLTRSHRRNHLQLVCTFALTLAGEREYAESMFGIWKLIIASGAITLGLYGQNAHSLLAGTVLDRSGGAIAAARVTVTANGTHTNLSVLTDATGRFSLSLAAGSYCLQIEKEAFVPLAKSIEIGADALPSQDFVLQVAPLQGAVTITENAGYLVTGTAFAAKTLTPLRDLPQSVAVVTQSQIRDQLMMSVADVVRYVPGITASQGEGNRDQLIIRGNNTTADFFVNGVRDDVQYFRDLYNLEQVEALKGPNAMIFGRGGGGGIINRTTKEASFMPLRELSLQGGSFGNKRVAADLAHPFNERVAFRMNGVYENSDSFRNGVNLERYGISPTATWLASPQTKFVFAYEHFRDMRVADRGIPTLFASRSAFYGNPNDAPVRAVVNLGSVALEHQAGRVNIRNRTLIGDYDKFYRNYVPALTSISAYDNATARRNAFNQTDVTYTAHSGPVRHSLLTGAEFGRQSTGNLRRTGYFNNVTTSTPGITTDTPVTFRQSASDANNQADNNVAAVYMQDQLSLSRFVQVIAGIRFDRFDLRYHNNRNNERLARIDNLISPRLGLVLKPVAAVSVYANYSVSYLPSAGDQFASLTTILQQLKPEKFTNYEAGVKWDIHRSLTLTTAVYRLDRTNTRSIDPNDATRIIQTGSQRTNGFEVGAQGSVTRAWQISGGAGFQDAYIRTATAAARAGLKVGEVPHFTFSFWNNFKLLPRLGAGLGVLNRSDMFATIDNTVNLPGYTRADAALFFSLTEKVRLQANVENLFDRQYFLNAHTNTNLSPGSPRAVRIGLTARF
jgi:catecholate siderophore receptor